MEEKHTNIEEIYTYTEKRIEAINKNIDGLGSKLTSTLGFSGVLLKFVSDMATNEKHVYPFWFVSISSITLLIGIGFCTSGLYARDAGCIVDPKALLEDSWWYSATDELLKLRIVRQWHKNIDSLDNLLDHRQNCFNTAIGLLASVAVLFCVINIILLIH